MPTRFVDNSPQAQEPLVSCYICHDYSVRTRTSTFRIVSLSDDLSYPFRLNCLPLPCHPPPTHDNTLSLKNLLNHIEKSPTWMSENSNLGHICQTLSRNKFHAAFPGVYSSRPFSRPCYKSGSPSHSLRRPLLTWPCMWVRRSGRQPRECSLRV